MEEDKIELKTLNEALYYMKKINECFIRCNSVTGKEYEKFSNYWETLKDRKTDLEIELKNKKILEV